MRLLAALTPLSALPHWLPQLLEGAVSLSLGVLSTSKRFRARAQSSLAVRHGSTRSATAVAALIGAMDPAVVQATAREHFRCIRLDLLKQADLLDNEPDPALFERSKPAQVGEVDAFVSHSWHDDARDKFSALQAWGDEFRAAHGRWPTVWLDKACIDQANLVDDLVCLPVFLAACNELLVLAGPTWSSRLWCIVELLCFVQMGGSRETIKVRSTLRDDRALGEDGEPRASRHMSARVLLATVDVSAATCTIEEDRQRLLGVFETAFGGLGPCNAALREMLQRTEQPVVPDASCCLPACLDSLVNAVSARLAPDRESSRGGRVRPTQTDASAAGASASSYEEPSERLWGPLPLVPPRRSFSECSSSWRSAASSRASSRAPSVVLLGPSASHPAVLVSSELQSVAGSEDLSDCDEDLDESPEQTTPRTVVATSWGPEHAAAGVASSESVPDSPV